MNIIEEGKVQNKTDYTRFGATEEETMWTMWEKEKHRHIYDPFLGVLNFEHRCPTDHKLNKRVSLPKPLNDLEEFGCELKKRDYVKAFNKYVSTDPNSEKMYIKPTNMEKSKSS